MMRLLAAAGVVVALAACSGGESSADDGSFNPFERGGLDSASSMDIIRDQGGGSELWVTVSDDGEVAALAETLDVEATRVDAAECGEETLVNFYGAGDEATTVVFGCGVLVVGLGGDDPVAVAAPSEFEDQIAALLAALPQP